MLDITEFSLSLPFVGLPPGFMQNNGSASTGLARSFTFCIRLRHQGHIQYCHIYIHLGMLENNYCNLIASNFPCYLGVRSLNLLFRRQPLDLNFPIQEYPTKGCPSSIVNYKYVYCFKHSLLVPYKTTSPSFSG